MKPAVKEGDNELLVFNRLLLRHRMNSTPDIPVKYA